MAQRRIEPVQPADPPSQASTIPSLPHQVSDPTPLLEEYGRVAPLRRQPSSRVSDTESEAATRKRKKAEPVKSACAQCQKRKTKCSGDRPTCRFCVERGLECSWDIRDGLTRTADLKQKLQDANGRGDTLKRLLSDEANRGAAVRQKLEAAEERQEDLTRLMEAMRSSTDEVSTMLLARLRLGEPIKTLIDSLRVSNGPSEGDRLSSGSRSGLASHTNSSGSGSSMRNRSNSSIATPSSISTSPDPSKHRPDYRPDSGESGISPFSAPRTPLVKSTNLCLRNLIPERGQLLD